MAMIEFDVTSITTAATTMGTGVGMRVYYGTLFNETGYWVRGPETMEPIGECITTTPTALNNWGLYYFYATTSAAPVSGGLPMYGGPLKVSAFERGGRWICVADASGAPGGIGVDTQTASRKVLRLYYRGINEGMAPPA